MKEELKQYNKVRDSKSVTQWYGKMQSIRALIQLIPSIGGFLDTLLGIPAYYFEQERLELLFKYIGDIFESIEHERLNLDWANTDQFRDILRIAIESSAKSRSEEKIKMNAMILSNTLFVENDGSFMPEEYLLALEDLTPIEISALFTFYETVKDQQQLRESGNAKAAEKLSWRESIKQQCRLDDEDIEFIMKRIQRSGLISELVGANLSYSGGSYRINPTFERLVDYLSKNPIYSE